MNTIRVYILLILCLVRFASVSQNPETIQFQIKQDTNISAYCKVFSNDKNIVYRECYSQEDSTLKFNETIIDNKLSGIRNTYYPNGQIYTQMSFLKGRSVGSYLEYYENGKLSISGQFGTIFIDPYKENYCETIEVSLGPDNPGTISHEECFTSPRHGKWTYYSDNGKKNSQGYSKDNRRIGEWLIFDIYTGKIAERKDYGYGKN